MRQPAVGTRVGVGVHPGAGVGAAVEEDVVVARRLVNLPEAAGAAVVGELLDAGRRGDRARSAVAAKLRVVDEPRPLGDVVGIREVVDALDGTVVMAARVIARVVLVVAEAKGVGGGLGMGLPA